ncbi:MAG: serine/threonine protein kinase [Gammaproteobacteria bacterium]|nr:serine/threonine protein kinase [Gammaproteobacteria bacterium]
MADLAARCPNCMAEMADRGVCGHCGTAPGSLARSPVALPEFNTLNDRFLVGRVLGRPGGFGVTYLAWDQVLQTAVAIKEFLPLSSVSREPGTLTIQPNSEHDAVFFRRGLQIFMQEARTLAQFSHPNIVRIRDCFEANGTAYMVMDYQRGEPLDQLVKRAGGRLDETHALDIMLPILDGLQAVHARRFLHRDIKPQNIYVTADGVPILLDFGAARMALSDSTKSMTVMLSGGFAPFEQYHKKGDQGPWSDVYACAATLYFLVTGNVPNDAIERRHDDRLIPPVSLNPRLSKAFSNAIMRGLALDPAARPRTVQALRMGLTGATASMPLGASSGAPARPAAPAPVSTVVHYSRAPEPHRTRPWMLLAIGLAVGIVAWRQWTPSTAVADVPQVRTAANERRAPEAAAATPGAARAKLVTQPALPAPTPVFAPRLQDAPPPAPPRVEADTSASAVVGRLQQQPFPPAPVPAPSPQTGDRSGAAPFAAGRPQPPPFAFEACRGKSRDARCEVRSPAGREPGHCQPFELQRLACVPDGHRAERGKDPRTLRYLGRG